MPTVSVSERLGKITSKVMPELLAGRTDVEKALLKAADIIQQQNEILARSTDEQNTALDSIQEQAFKTNGRVTESEKKIADHADFIKAMKDASSRRTFWLVTLIPIFGILLEIFAKRTGLL